MGILTDFHSMRAALPTTGPCDGSFIPDLTPLRIDS